MKKILSIILILLAAAMIYMSVCYKALPPGITGAGFIVIAIIFLTERK